MLGRDLLLGAALGCAGTADLTVLLHMLMMIPLNSTHLFYRHTRGQSEKKHRDQVLGSRCFARESDCEVTVTSMSLRHASCQHSEQFLE